MFYHNLSDRQLLEEELRSRTELSLNPAQREDIITTALAFLASDGGYVISEAIEASLEDFN
jgi:hypothetical protein